jgi:predicted ATPase
VFLREQLSEGTLRAAGVLAALFQPSAAAGQVSLIGIEEPGAALHRPASARSTRRWTTCRSARR